MLPLKRRNEPTNERTKNLKSGARARARARVFFQDCVILPGGVERLGHLTQQSHATNARNARTQQTRSTPNKIRKHAKSRTTAENIAYRTNQLPVRAKEC